MTRTHTSWTLTVEFLSDWHVGSGLERPGSVDRLVQRDEDDFPFLPAKTLTGMLRDAAEQAALALDEGNGDRWHRWVHWLFGDQPARANDDPREMLRHDRPTDAALSIRPARFPESLRKALRDDRSWQPDPRRRELRESLVFAKPGVTIERNGRAADNTLRLDEMARVGVSLNAAVVLVHSGLTDEQRTFALNLLALATTFVERLGGKRRRGAGRVALTLRGEGVLDKDALAIWLEQAKSPPEIPTGLPCGEPKADGEVESNVTATGAEWVAYPFRVTLKTPLLVAERTLGNVVKSLDFVPGTYFLPIVRRALKTHLPMLDKAISTGDLRVTPATVEIDDQRGLPVPAALFHAKGDDRGFERDGGMSNGLVRTDKEHVKDFREGYVLPIDPLPAGSPENSPRLLPKLVKPHKVVRPHNTVQDESQRPTTEVGGVFSYEAIAAGTVLRGEVRVRKAIADGLKATKWWETVPIVQSLGRSKKDDYGQVELKFDEPGDVKPTSNRPVREGCHTFWLTSDALLPGERLDAEPTLDALHGALAAALKIELAGPLKIDEGPVKVDQRGNGLDAAFLRHRRIESWHVGWGLPRPSLVCLAAGSCVRLRFTTPVDGAKLAALEVEGIGLRRAEGYGMLRIDDPLLAADLAEKSQWKGCGPSVPGERPPLSTIRDAESLDLAQRMERECWRRRIRQAAMKAASENVLGLKPKSPNPAQAGLLRNLLRIGLDDPQRLVASLRRIHEMRQDKWPPETMKTVVNLLDDKDAVWDALEARDWPKITPGGRKALCDSLWPEAVRTLIEAALKAHQRAQEGSL